MQKGVDIVDNRTFLSAADVAEELGSSKAYAYKLIKVLNKELEEKGYIVIPGKVSRNYFREKMYGGTRKEYAGLQRQ